MAFTKAQLQAEINGDAKALGYAALKASNAYVALAAKLNGTYGAVGIVWRTDLARAEILNCLVWTELAAATVTQWTALQTLLIPATIDASNANVRALFVGLFTGAPTSLANITAAAKKVNPSRAEELWGYGAVVSEQDVANAITT